MQQMPIKIYICPQCNYDTPHRWVLARHLFNVHQYSEKKARVIAMISEYLLNPHAWSVRNEISKKEVKMKKVKTLQNIIDELEEKNVNPEKVLVNPREISVITDSDDDSDNESDEE